MDREKKKLLESMTAGVEYLDTFPGGGQAWRVIAAFDCDPAAEAYVRACSRAHNMAKHYRVKKFLT